MVQLFYFIVFCLILHCTSANEPYITRADKDSSYESVSLTSTVSAKNADSTQEITIFYSTDQNRLGLLYTSESCHADIKCSAENKLIPDNKYRNTRSCMCDENCVQYRDCCNTSAHYKIQQPAYPNTYKCRSFPDQAGTTSMYMIASCSQSWHDEATISEKCSSSTKHKLHPSNQDLTTPVTSSSTNVTYSNAYCALCNFDENFQFWKVAIKCTEDDIVFPDDRVNYVKKYYSSKKSLPMGCSLYAYIPRGIQRGYCLNADPISTCPLNWTDKSTMERCSTSSESLVADHEHGPITYRNKYCAYCNGVPGTRLVCATGVPFPETPQIRLRSSNSFTILFDFQEAKILPLCRDSDPVLLKIRNYFCPVQNVTTAETNDNWFFSWYTTVAVSFSILFLMLHLLVFCLVKEMRNVGAKNLASFSVALIFAYTSFLLGGFAERRSSFCTITAILTYYFFLVAFVCLLTTSYNLWRTFWYTVKKLRLVVRSNTKFVAFLLWNWLFPVIPVSFAFYVEFYSSTLAEYKPRFGERVCWFSNKFSLLVFFALPAFLMMLMNCVFFAHTWYIIKTNRIESTEVNKKIRVDYRMFLRLALFTGVTWVTGFVGGFFQNDLIWFVFVFLNATQGVFIFVVFDCKRKIMKEFVERIGFLRTVTLCLKISESNQKPRDNVVTLKNITNHKVHN